jgi:hypothetical protein
LSLLATAVYGALLLLGPLYHLLTAVERQQAVGERPAG